MIPELASILQKFLLNLACIPSHTSRSAFFPLLTSTILYSTAAVPAQNAASRCYGLHEAGRAKFARRDSARNEACLNCCFVTACILQSRPLPAITDCILFLLGFSTRMVRPMTSLKPFYVLYNCQHHHISVPISFLKVSRTWCYVRAHGVGCIKNVPAAIPL